MRTRRGEEKRRFNSRTEQRVEDKELMEKRFFKSCDKGVMKKRRCSRDHEKRVKEIANTVQCYNLAERSDGKDDETTHGSI